MPVVRNSATGSGSRTGLAARRSRPTRDVVRLGIDEDRRAHSPSLYRNLSIAIYEKDKQMQLLKEQPSELSPLTPPPPSPSPSPTAASVAKPVSLSPVATAAISRASAPPESSPVSYSNGVSTPISSASTPASARSTNTGNNNPKSHARKREEGHVKRPSNAFILFRTFFVANRLIPSTIESHSQNLSRIAGQVWRGLSAAEKAPWMEKAKEVKREHEKMHPGYAYHPTESYSLRGRRRVLKGRGEREEHEARKRCEKIAELVKKGKANDELEKAVKTIEVGSNAMEIEAEVVSPTKAKKRKSKSRARRTKQPTSSSITVQQPEARAEEQKLVKWTSWPPRDPSLTLATANVDPAFASASASFSPAEPLPDSFSAEPTAGSSASSRSLSIEMLDDMGFDVLGVGVKTWTVEGPGEMDVVKENSCMEKGIRDVFAPPATPGISAERESSGAKENLKPLASSSHSHSSHSLSSPPPHSVHSHSPFSSSLPLPPLFKLPNTFIPPGREGISFVPSFSSVYLPLRPVMDGEKEKGKEAVRLPPMKVPLDQTSTLCATTNATARESGSCSLPAFAAATAPVTTGSNSNLTTTIGLRSKVGSSFPGALRVPDKPRLNGFASNASNGSSSNNGKGWRRSNPSLSSSSWSMNGVVGTNGNATKEKDSSRSAGKTATTINGVSNAFASNSGTAPASASVLLSKVRTFGAGAPPSSSPTSVSSKNTAQQHERAPVPPTAHEMMLRGDPNPSPSAQEAPALRQERVPTEEVDPSRFPPRLRLRHYHRLGVSRLTTTSSPTNIGVDGEDSAAFKAPAFRRRRDEIDGDGDLELESSGTGMGSSSGRESEEICA